MYDNPYAGQLEQQVLCADPTELVALLFDHLVLRVNEARSHLRAGDRAARAKAITQSLAIVAELARSLDLAQGGSLAANLMRLYDFTADRLTQAQMHENEQALVEVLRAIEPLRDAWHEVRMQGLASGSAYHSPDAVVAGEGFAVRA
jgi:flagellar protein FliS